MCVCVCLRCSVQSTPPPFPEAEIPGTRTPTCMSDAKCLTLATTRMDGRQSQLQIRLCPWKQVQSPHHSDHPQACFGAGHAHQPHNPLAFDSSLAWA